MNKYLLSFNSSKEGDVVNIHADKVGLEELEKMIKKLKEGLEKDECEHEHFFTEERGVGNLSTTMLEQERNENCNQVQHVKVYAWTEEWSKKHNLR